MNRLRHHPNHISPKQIQLPCPHYWQIDRSNYGRCLYCGEERDFSKDNKRVFSIDYMKGFARGTPLTRSLCAIGEYYMQGSYAPYGFSSPDDLTMIDD
ncbi:MAG: hypothetical protein WC479_05935 [Candidatus Izemoplasmatales bacterium]